MKVITACLAFLPCSTEVIWSYPSVEEAAYALFEPLSAFQVASIAVQSMGVPSLKTALGLMVSVTFWLPPATETFTSLK